MKRLWIPSILFFYFHFAAATECVLQKNDEITTREGEKVLIIYEIKNSSTCELPNLTELQKFQYEIGSQLESTDPFDLIDRQLKLWSKYPNVPKNYISASKLVREGPLAQKVHPVDKVDALLFNEHLKTLDYRHEFLAHILKLPSSDNLLIFFTPGDVGLVNVHPKTEALLSEYISRGFRFLAHLHTHPFLLDQEDIGAVPVFSLVDVSTLRQLSQRLPLMEAWVTNGFHSLKIPVKDLDLFSNDN